MRDAYSGVYITVDSISETPEPHTPRVSASRSRGAKIGEGGAQRTYRHRTCGGAAQGLVHSYCSRCGKIDRWGQAHRS